MELDLINAHFDLQAVKPGEIEEALEDPFALRFIPDVDREDGAVRYYALGRTVGGRFLFLAFWTDGKSIRPVAVRDMTESEERFYERKYAALK